MKSRGVILLAVLFVTAPGWRVVASNDETPKHVELFVAGQEGYAVYRIPGIIVTSKGTLIAYCEARRSDRGDWGAIDLFARRSTDGGQTWSKPYQIGHFGPKIPKNPVALKQKLATNSEQTVNNPVMLADHAGKVHLLYCVEYSRCFHRVSHDDGVSFDPAKDITIVIDKIRLSYDWRVIATGPGHGVAMRSGRLVVPIWLSTGTGGHAHRPSVTTTLFSDDQGQSWEVGEIAVANTPTHVNPNETCAVELADGRLMLNVRNESKQHRRLITTSPDGARGWSPPKFDDRLVEPICMASLCRFSLAPKDDCNRILFANPDNLSRADRRETPGLSRERRNLTIQMSLDEGTTWPISRVLDAGVSGYNDLAVLPDKTIVCLYERGSTQPNQMYKTGSLTLSRFSLAWLTSQSKAPTKPRAP